MNLSKEVRLLQNKWAARTGWPQRLEWLELDGIRGWSGQRIEFNSPIVAICGENGSGKSTILQAASVVYYLTGDQNDTFAGEVFPNTLWQVFCASWCHECLSKLEADKVIKPIREALLAAV